MKKRISGKSSQQRSSKPESKGGYGRKYQPKRPMDRPDQRPKDNGYKDTPAMSIEERKAAQLAKWRKELGLEDE